MSAAIRRPSASLRAARALVPAAVLGLSCTGLPIQQAHALERTATSWAPGDFESGGALLPPGWRTNATAGSTRAAASTSRSLSGTRALQIDDGSATEAAWAESYPLGIVGGSTYIFQGYVYASRGAATQTITVRYHDSTGKIIASSSGSSTAAELMWTRVIVKAAAPAGAVRATVRIASAVDGTGSVWWDSVDYLRPMFNNGQFENTPAVSTEVPWWSVDATGGEVSTTTDPRRVRTGNRALHLRDTSTTGAPKVVSNGSSGGQSYMPRVFPGVTHDFTGWVLPVSGTPKLVVSWYDANKRFLSSSFSVVNKPAGQWAYYKAQIAAPLDAQYATLTLTGDAAGTSEAYWDEMQLSPTPPAPVPTYDTRPLGSPVKAAANTKTSGSAIVSGRPVVYAGVSGYPGALQVLDIQTNEMVANVPVPNTEAIVAVTNTPNGQIYVGGGDGHLYRWTPGASSMEDLGRVSANAISVVSLTVAPDGRVWGGTTPRSEVFSFNPATRELTDIGSVSATDSYARSITATSDGIFVGTGPTSPKLVHIDRVTRAKTTIALPAGVSERFVYELGTRGNYLIVKGDQPSSYRLYDHKRGIWPAMPRNAAGGELTNQQPMPLASTGEFYYTSYKQILGVNGITLATAARAAAPAALLTTKRDLSLLKGTLGGRSGEFIIAHDPDGTIVALQVGTWTAQSFKVDWREQAMRLKSLSAGADGKLYAGAFGGASLGVLDPATGRAEQYPKVANNNVDATIGEIEGSIANGGYQFLGSYTGGKVFRYDPTQPWVDGSNPKMIARTSTQGQDRPLAWAASGQRTYFGTIPVYGKLTGALGIIDTPTATPRLVQPAANQSIVSMAAKGSVVYYGTSRWGGYGATPSTRSAVVAAYDTATNRKLWEVTPQIDGQSVGSVILAPNGQIWAAVGWNLYEIRPTNGQVLRRVSLRPDPQPTNQVQWSDTSMGFIGGRLYLTIGTDTYSLDTTNLHVDRVVGPVSTAQVSTSHDGKLYYASGTQVVEVTPSNASVSTTAKAPFKLDRCGVAQDTYVIPYEPGVTYEVGGVRKDTGNYLSGGQSVTITAKAQAGWRLEGPTSWTMTFTNTGCA